MNKNKPSLDDLLSQDAPYHADLLAIVLARVRQVLPGEIAARLGVEPLGRPVVWCWELLCVCKFIIEAVGRWVDLVPNDNRTSTHARKHASTRTAPADVAAHVGGDVVAEVRVQQRLLVHPVVCVYLWCGVWCVLCA